MKEREKPSIQAPPKPVEIAIELVKRGFSVFPCDEKPDAKGKPSKAPYTKHGFKDATQDEKQIQAYWRQYPQALIGIACGEPSGGLVVLDLDKDKSNQDFLTRINVEGVVSFNALLGRDSSSPLPHTYTVETWSGGKQLYFRASQEQLDEIKNINSKIAPHVDIKARGGYVIAAGSRIIGGIGDGREYSVELLTDIAQLPDEIFNIIRKPKQRKQDRIDNKHSYTISGNLPYRVQKYVEEALLTEVRELSITNKGIRNERLNTAAFNLGTLISKGILDESTVAIELEKACKENGLIENDGIESFQKTFNSGLNAGKQNPRDLGSELEGLLNNDKSHKQSIQAIEPQWAHPVFFDEFELKSPRMENLPSLISDYSLALAEALQVPVEMPLTMTLAAGAIASQGRFETEVREGYTEQLSLYLLCLLEPGQRKSATVSACSEPIVEYEKELRQSKQQEVERQKSELKTIEKVIERKRNDASKANSIEEIKRLSNEIYELEQNLPKVESLPRLLVDNVTPEALAAIMTENQEQIGIMEGEGGIFNILAGQYKRFTMASIYPCWFATMGFKEQIKIWNTLIILTCKDIKYTALSFHNTNLLLIFRHNCG